MAYEGNGPGMAENGPRRGDAWRHEMMKRNNKLDSENKFAGTSERSGSWVRIRFLRLGLNASEQRKIQCEGCECRGVCPHARTCACMPSRPLTYPPRYRCLQYSSAFHNTTAIVGAGVLGLPYAMKYLTWPGGVVMMLFAWGTSLYTLYQLVFMHELDGAASTYDILAGMILLC